MREPDGHEQVGGADVEAFLGRDPEPGNLRSYEPHQCDSHADESAEVTEPPTVAGYTANPPRRSNRRQKRVVEHVTHLERHVGDHVERKRHQRRVRQARRHKGEQRRRADAQRRGHGQEPSARARPIGRRAENRREHGGEDPAQRHRPRPPGGPRQLVRRHGLGEVRRVDEGADQRRERGVRPVVESPRPNDARDVLAELRNGRSGGGRQERHVGFYACGIVMPPTISSASARTFFRSTLPVPSKGMSPR